MARDHQFRRFVAVAVLLLAAGGCGSATPAASSAPSITPAASSAPSIAPADPAGFVEATCTAIDELSLAWGNPDTAKKSEAWKSFEAAIERQDTALLDSAAAEILTHLAAARAATARAATWAPGAPASAEFEAVLVGLETQVTTVRDARGDPAVAQMAAETMQASTWPRFWPYIQLLVQTAQTNEALKVWLASHPSSCLSPGAPSPSGS